MRLRKEPLKTQRRQLDKRLNNPQKLMAMPKPSNGWIRAIRESLGMTLQQLAKRMGISSVSAYRLEQREPKGTVTLESLERAAKALNCRLVYALVPEAPLETMLDAQAKKAVRKKLSRVSHSMNLEKQGVDAEESDDQALELAKQLKAKMSSAIWDE